MTPPESTLTSTKPTPKNLHTGLGEFSGAFADLGTFLPLVLGMIALNQFSAQGLFLGFGLFALATAFLYRRPIPVQPMKVISALVIAQGLTPGMLQASGIMMGVILLVLAASGAISWMARQLSPAVSIGIQLAIGIQLLQLGMGMMSDAWLLGICGFLVIFVGRFFPLRYLVMPMVIGAGIFYQIEWGNTQGQIIPSAPSIDLNLSASLSTWSPSLPTVDEWSSAALLLVLPQLALTLTNAVITTSAMAKELFPQDAHRITAKKLAISSGLANLILPFFGGCAMCHGAGGLAVQHHFGARSFWAPLIFGSACLLTALFWCQDLAWFLGMIPMPILGSLLGIAGLQLAYSKRLIDARPYCKLVILATALTCLVINTAAGLALGVALELARRKRQLSTAS